MPDHADQIKEVFNTFSTFRERCQDLNVWYAVDDQLRIMKAAGMRDPDAKSILMSVWEGCLLSLENGGKASDWDFDKMKPKRSKEKGAFEVSPIEVTRKLTVYQMLSEHQARRRYFDKEPKRKDGPIESNDSLMVGGIEIKLKTPNSMATRRQELEWVTENLFQYRQYDKDPEGRRGILEQAPTHAACSWMEYAASNHTSFMKELPKLLPEELNQSETEKASEVYVNQVMSDIEKTVQVVCPNCSNKF